MYFLQCGLYVSLCLPGWPDVKFGPLSTPLLVLILVHSPRLVLQAHTLAGAHTKSIGINL